MAKTEVYSWRLSSGLKSDLEDAARSASKSLAELLEDIAKDWLTRSMGGMEDEEERQQHLRSSALRFVGAIKDSNPLRAEGARAELRARLARRHDR